MNHKDYYIKAIDEIITLLKNNLILLYNTNDSVLVNLRDYCKNNTNKKYNLLQYNDLLFFAEEALAELINCDYLYDFRGID